jgi:hypothetical protein
MNRDDIVALKSNFETTFNSPQGKEVMKYLEGACGWYRSVYSEGSDRDVVLINDGRRQVLATIKSILELSPEQIAVISGVEI